MRIYRIGLILGAQLAIAQSQDPPRIDACDLLRDATAFNGRIVAANGVIRKASGSQEDGPWFSSPGCPIEITVHGVEFGNAIELTPPWYPSVLFDHKIDFTWNQESFRRFGEMLGTMDPKTEQIHATVVGLFETRVPIESLIAVTPAHPEGISRGYGHLGTAPRRL